MTAGDIYTVAGDATRGSAGDGGPATAAELSHPIRLTVDAVTADLTRHLPGRFRAQRPRAYAR